MRLDHALGCRFDLFEVVANHAGSLTTVDQKDELRFNSCVEVLLDKWSLVAVDLDVKEFTGGSGQVLVIPLDLGAHGVPGSAEIDHRVGGSLLIKAFDYVFNAFRDNIVLAGHGLHGASGQVPIEEADRLVPLHCLH